MKHTIIKFTLLSLLVTVVSCKKQLDLVPTDSIDVTKAFTTVDDLQKGLLGVYSANSSGNRIYIASLLSDELKISNENRGQGQFTFKWQYSSTEAEHNSDYAQYYVMLDRLHRVLAAFDQVKTTTGSENDRKEKIKAELIGLRGVALYELLIRFMPPGYDAGALGVPIMLASDLTAKPARNTVGQVVTQIETDLAFAREDAQMQVAPDAVLDLSKAAIAAYQARVALLKKDWKAAITYATDAITLSGKSLPSAPNPAYFSSYSNYWKDANESETIWKYKNETKPQLLFRDANGDVFFEPADKLKRQYTSRSADIRYPAFFGASGGDTSIVKKYPGSASGPTINDLKLIRLSEMYLLRAEAYGEDGSQDFGTADLNTVRKARIKGYANATFPDAAQLVDAVINERYKELCFEGFRFFDLKRKSLPVTRDASDVQSTNWQTLPANDYRWALPIPQDEILANPNAQQNPGY